MSEDHDNPYRHNFMISSDIRRRFQTEWGYHVVSTMASQPLSMPDFPPAGPWDAYVSVIIWIPLILRILFLIVPFRNAIRKLAPHAGWALKQVRELPVRGFGLLAANELLAILFPPLIVLLVRLLFDPIGWQDWSDVSNLGGAILLLLLFFWVFFDIFRIGKIRKMLKAVAKHDVNKLRKVADTGLSVRSWLQRFANRESNNQPADDTALAKETGGRALKTGMLIWGSKIIKTRKLTPAGLLSSVAVGAAIEVARSGAGRISDMVDNKMQDEFDRVAEVNSRTLLILFSRDLFMGIAPLIALGLLPIIF